MFSFRRSQLFTKSLSPEKKEAPFKAQNQTLIRTEFTIKHRFETFCARTANLQYPKPLKIGLSSGLYALWDTQEGNYGVGGVYIWGNLSQRRER